jgi:copper chaperone CopZ
MIGKVLGKKSLIGYLGAIITGALLSGLFIDNFLPPEWFKLSEHFGHMGHNHQEMLPVWLKTGSAVLLLLLIFNGYLQKFIKSRKMADESKSTSSSKFDSDSITTIYVGGMTCNHCKENVENSIKAAKGVEDVAVDLTTGKVNIRGKSFDLEKIRTGIKSIGYKIIGEDR